MTDSTRRAIRTGVQTLLGIAAAVAVIVPIVGAQFPQAAAVGGVALGITGVVTKAWNTLEDKGLIPSWLKDGPGKHEAPQTPAQ